MQESVQETTLEASAPSSIHHETMSPNHNTNSIVVSLEEQLNIQEATLKNLLKRQKQQVMHIDEANRQRLIHQERLQVLQARRATLEEAAQKHVNLKADIQDALEKSQERLVRVVAAAGLQGQEDESGEDTEDTAISDNNNNNNDEGVRDTLEMEQDDADGQGQQDETDAKQEVIVSIPVSNLHLDEQVVTKFLQTRNDTGLAVLLPCLNSVDLIQRIMNVTALEVLTLDHKNIEGNHRQECLWKTCLDLLCVSGKVAASTASILGSDHTLQDEVSASPPIQTDTAISIDPYVVLCPYELAGTCADPYCRYQHMKPRNVESQQILARERLPLPTLKLPDTPSSSSRTAIVTSRKETVSPPYSPFRKRRRLDGEQQHDEEDEESEQTTDTQQDDDQDSVGTQVLSTQNNDNDEKENENVILSGGDDQDESDSDDEPMAMAWNDDFVTLPPMLATGTGQDGDSDDSASSDGNENETEGKVVAQEGCREEQEVELSIEELWWQGEHDVARMKDSPRKLSTLRLSVTDWLEMVGGFRVEHVSDDDGTFTLVLKCMEFPSKPASAIAYVGRIVDCVRVCIHAGRFDLAFTLCGFVQEVKFDTDKMNNLGTIGSMLQMFVEEGLVNLIDAAFCFNSDRRTTLCCSFETELFLTTSSEALRLAYRKVSSDLDAWPESLTKLGSFLQQANERDWEHQRSPKDETQWKETPKEWETLVGTPDESKVLEDDEDEYYRQLSLFDSLLNAIKKGWSSMDTLSQCPMDLLVDDVLKPILSQIRRLVDQPNDIAVDTAPLLFKTGYILLGCGEAVCAQFVTSNGVQSLDTSSTLTAIDSCVYQIITCLTNIASIRPLAELCLAPLYALSVSLASTLRRYGKAQRRLEAALNAVLFSKGLLKAMSSGYLVYSELLWSQLIRLKSSLPLLPSGKTKRLTLLPVAIQSEHRLIASTVNAFGVEPNHVTLCGDWNLFQAFDAENKKYVLLGHVRKYCFQMFASLFSDKSTPNGTISSSLLCNLCYLPLCAVDMPMRILSTASLAFPSSTMLVGNELSALVANKCELNELPRTFGLYFRNLMVLKLAENNLTVLPDSIGKLRSLADLDVSHNELESLPPTIGSLKKLTRLNASHNAISNLPLTLTKCKSLEEVVLIDNPIRMHNLPNNLALKCTNLYKIQVDVDDDTTTTTMDKEQDEERR